MRLFKAHFNLIYNNTSRELEFLAKEVFVNKEGCSDGYKKFWQEISITWGSIREDGWGGDIMIETDRLEQVRLKGKIAWNGKEEEIEEEFWAWYPLYRFLSRTMSMSAYTHTNIFADFWSYSHSLADDRNCIEYFFNDLLAPIQKWGLYDALIYSVKPPLSPHEETPIYIYILQESFEIKEEEDNVTILLPQISSAEELEKYVKQIPHLTLKEAKT